MTATDADLVVPVWQDCGLGMGDLTVCSTSMIEYSILWQPLFVTLAISEIGVCGSWSCC